jgi:hypothetical protein
MNQTSLKCGRFNEGHGLTRQGRVSFLVYFLFSVHIYNMKFTMYIYSRCTKLHKGRLLGVSEIPDETPEHKRKKYEHVQLYP